MSLKSNIIDFVSSYCTASRRPCPIRFINAQFGRSIRKLSSLPVREWMTEQSESHNEWIVVMNAKTSAASVILTRDVDEASLASLEDSGFIILTKARPEHYSALKRRNIPITKSESKELNQIPAESMKEIMAGLEAFNVLRSVEESDPHSSEG